MSVLTFKDPREVMAYWDRFENRSIKPVGAYLWRWEDEKADRDQDDADAITPIRREELDMMVLDSKHEEIRVDAAIWAQTNPAQGPNARVIILTHVNDPEGNHPWIPSFLLGLSNKVEVSNLTKQIAGESAVAFSVVE